MAEALKMTGTRLLNDRMLRAIDTFPGRIFLLLDHDFHFQWVGASVESILGHRSEDMVGQASWNFFHPDDIKRVTREMRRYATDPALATRDYSDDSLSAFTIRFRRSDGSYQPCLLTARNFYFDPEVKGFLLIATPNLDRTTQENILLAISVGRPTEEVLGMICTFAQDWIVGTQATITSRIGPITTISQSGNGPVPRFASAQCVSETFRTAAAMTIRLDQGSERRSARAERRSEYGAGTTDQLWTAPIVNTDKSEVMGVLALRAPGHMERLFGIDITISQITRIAGVTLSIEKLNQRLHYSAEHDPLTDLANRTLFAAALHGLSDDDPASVLAIDLDDFKPINDQYGHHIGDEALVKVARRLQSLVRDDDVVARLGGDEFAVLCRNGTDGEVVAQRIVRTLNEPMTIDGINVSVGASIGVAVREPGQSAVDLMRAADRLLYDAKRSGKNTVRLSRVDQKTH